VPLKPTPPGDVAAAVGAIFDLYETSGEMVLQWLSDERRRPEVKKTLDEGRADHRDWVKLAFAPQLEACAKTARTRLFNVLVVATDVYVWSKLRKDNGLARPEAEGIVRGIVEAVVERETDHGKVYWSGGGNLPPSLGRARSRAGLHREAGDGTARRTGGVARHRSHAVL
jgi:hypothetical protein